jgi:hypothetical protein
MQLREESRIPNGSMLEEQGAWDDEGSQETGGRGGKQGDDGLVFKHRQAKALRHFDDDKG